MVYSWDRKRELGGKVCRIGSDEMAQWVKALAAKTDNLSLSLGTNTVGGDKDFCS